jgi:hypothetical protein
MIIFLFPLSCGVFPAFSRILPNLILYSIELSLWFPLLVIVELTTGRVAEHYLTKDGSIGLYIVATELIAIF